MTTSWPSSAARNGSCNRRSPGSAGPTSANNAGAAATNIRRRAGLRVVRGEVSGDDLGTALLEVRPDPAASGASYTLLPLTGDRSVGAAARQPPTKAAIHFGSTR